MWYGTGSTDRDPDEYIIYRLIWDEGMDGYVRDESLETLYLDADEFAASPYEIVYDEIKEPQYVKYWYYNEPGEDNYEAPYLPDTTLTSFITTRKTTAITATPTASSEQQAMI